MEGETAAVTLATIISNAGDVFGAAMGWMGTVATTVAGTPLLLIGCILGIGGIAISYFKRLV